MVKTRSLSEVESLLRALLSGPPRAVDNRRVLASVLFLTTLLVVAVPIGAFSTGVPLIALVAVAGLLYAGVLVLSGTVLEGLCGAVFVLCLFSGNLPLLERTTTAGAIQINLLLADFAVVPLAALFLYWNRGFVLPTERRLDTAVGYALGGVVLWSALAAVVSNGPSRFGAIAFVVTQVRYLLLFAVAVGVVRYTGLRTAVYSLLVALGGNLAYAVAEVLNRGSFGLNYLGDSPGTILGTFRVGPMVFESSMYAGGFVGTTRGLALLVVLFSPIAIERIVRGTATQRAIVAVSLLAGGFIVRVSASDSGWAAFLIVMLAAVATLTYVGLDSKGFGSTDGIVEYLYGYVSALGVAGIVVALSVGRASVVRAGGSSGGTSGGSAGTSGASAETSTSAGTSGSSGGASGGSVGTGGSEGSGAATETGRSTAGDATSELLRQLPLVDSSNLSVRIQQYVAAIDIGFAYPLFGLGGNNFPIVAESYGLPRPLPIHNVYLSHLASIGIPGSLLFTVAFVLPAIVAIRETLRIGNDERLLWGMIACGLVGFYAYNFWVTVYTNNAASLTFWVLAGAIVGASRYHGHERRDATPNVLTR